MPLSCPLRIFSTERSLSAGSGHATPTTVPGLRQHHLARVARGVALHAGADDRRLGDQQRHRLLLHVRAHQRAVGVVVLEERDHRRGHADDLLRRHVHVVDVTDGRSLKVVARAACDVRHREVALLVDGRVGLRDRVLVLLVGGQERRSRR